MEQLNTRRTNIVLALVIIAVVALYVVFIFLPNRREAIATEQQLQFDRAFIAQTEGLAAAIATAEHELDLVERYTREWTERTPREADLPALFAKLNQLATVAGVTTVGIDPSPAVEHETMQQFPVTLALTGSFREVFSLLMGIEHLPMPIWVEMLQIEKPRQDTGNVTCEIRLVMFAHKSGISD